MIYITGTSVKSMPICMTQLQKKRNGQKMGGTSAIRGGEAKVIKNVHVFNISQESLAQRKR